MNTKYSILLFFVFLNVTPISLFAETSVKDVEEHLMCMCKDKCGKMLVNCNCKFSDEMRTTIASKLASGLDKQQILAFYIDKYGEKVLAAPTKKGFNLFAWVTPFALLAVGFFEVRSIIQNWVQKNENRVDLKSNKPDKKELEKDTKYMSQLEKELKDFDNDD